MGVSIAVFNQLSKVAIYPLLSVTTSFVAEESASCKVSQNEQPNQEEEDLEKKASQAQHENKAGDGDGGETREMDEVSVSSGKNKEDGKVADAKMKKKKKKKAKMKYIPSVSSSMVVGLFLGILQTMLLIFSAKYILNIMGVKSVSSFQTSSNPHAWVFYTVFSFFLKNALQSLCMKCSIFCIRILQ